MNREAINHTIKKEKIMIKAIFTLLMSGMMTIGALAQTPVQPIEPVEPVTPIEPGSDMDDTTGKKVTKLSFGNMKVIIYEDNEDVNVKVDENGDTTIIVGKTKKNEKSGFYGTWQGLSICSNGMLTWDNKLNLPEEMKFIELDYAKSISAAFNFAPLQFAITKRFGIESGLGFQWNRYGLKNNYTLSFNEDSLYGIATPDYVYSKNVLKATYITLPLLIDINTHKNFEKSFHFAFGVIGGYKLGSRLKQEYEFEGREFEFKTRGHYYFNPFQAYATARIGYGNVLLFANYGLTRIFEQGPGPQVYPFQFGLHFIFA